VGSLEEAAFLDLLRIADMLSRGGVIGVLKAEDLSTTQYNVLRMEKRGLISQSRESRGRRIVMARFTTEGVKLVDRLHEPVQNIHRKQLGHWGKDQLRALAELLAAARARLAFIYLLQRISCTHI